MTEPTRRAEAYLTISPGSKKGSASIDRLTKGVPYSVDGGAIVIKIALEVPDRAFRPPYFEAEVAVPEDYVGPVYIRVPAVNPEALGEADRTPGQDEVES